MRSQYEMSADILYAVASILHKQCGVCSKPGVSLEFSLGNRENPGWDVSALQGTHTILANKRYR